MIFTTLTLSVALLAPPAAVDVPPLRHKWTPGEIAVACEKAEKDSDARLAALVAIPDAKRTFKDSFEAFDRSLADYGETVARLSFMKDIHPDSAVRDAGAACEERAGKYSVALSARKDLYLAMKGWLANAGAQPGAMDKLDAEQKRLVELTMLEFKKNGLELNDANRAKLVEIRKKLTELQTKFQKNLNEDKSSITVTNKADLAGLPEDFIAAHEDPKKKGTYIITTKYPDYYPVMENCTKESTRRALQLAFMNKGGPENLKLLDEAVALRAQAAKLLGYKVHADVVAEDRMAKNSATIAAFLTRMRKGLAPALESDTKKMQAIKSKDGKATINSWDWRFYMNEIKKRDFAIDDEAVRAYFPADKVLAGMFDVYAKTFELAIKELPLSKGDVWADGVKLYEIRDAKTKSLIGKFYADFYPRDGKYGHAAEFTLSSGRAVDAGYRIPMAALVVNFQPPKDGKAAQLSMDEVDTLFHEFGHVVHELLTTARYAQQSGTRTALDFVEAPSQMLENWAYHPEVLPMISSGMPADLAAKLNAARKYNAGVHYSRQLFLGSFDQALHTVDKVSSDLTAKKLWSEIMKFPEDPKEHFAGTFGHMMGGYDGGYYGYLWSEVFAADMFTRFAAEGVLNPKTGREYRDRVLARGRTVEPGVLLRDFLGREPNEEAFLKLLGIGGTSPSPAPAPAPKN